MPDVQHDRNRAAYMDYLYEIYDRENARPGLRSTYTGLAEQHRRRIGWKIAGDLTLNEIMTKIGKPVIDEEVANWHKRTDEPNS